MCEHSDAFSLFCPWNFVFNFLFPAPNVSCVNLWNLGYLFLFKSPFKLSHYIVIANYISLGPCGRFTAQELGDFESLSAVAQWGGKFVLSVFQLIMKLKLINRTDNMKPNCFHPVSRCKSTLSDTACGLEHLKSWFVTTQWTKKEACCSSCRAHVGKADCALRFTRLPRGGGKSF